MARSPPARITFSVELPLTDATGASPDRRAAWTDCEGPRLTRSTSSPLRAKNAPSCAASSAACTAVTLANPTRSDSSGWDGAVAAAAGLADGAAADGPLVPVAGCAGEPPGAVPGGV